MPNAERDRLVAPLPVILAYRHGGTHRGRTVPQWHRCAIVPAGYRSIMTQGPQGGTTAEPGRVTGRPEQEPRAAQGPMSDDVTSVPKGDEGPDAKKPGMPDATGPTG